MNATQTIMLAGLAIGVIVLAVGAVLLGRSVYRMYKLIVSLQAELQAHADLFLSKQADILARLDSIEENQEVLLENLERLQIANARLGFLIGELSDSAATLKPFEPLSALLGGWGEAASILRAVRVR